MIDMYPNTHPQLHGHMDTTPAAHNVTETMVPSSHGSPENLCLNLLNLSGDKADVKNASKNLGRNC